MVFEKKTRKTLGLRSAVQATVAGLGSSVVQSEETLGGYETALFVMCPLLLLFAVSLFVACVMYQKWKMKQSRLDLEPSLDITIPLMNRTASLKDMLNGTTSGSGSGTVQCAQSLPFGF
ncbi:hypothetical protein JTE90_008862 [Oedothorax gibbosus]|uniref:Uncharacterized protein n=1 Tax=Oedothorax gibbosus TaxID=931172 RepID=A0AAV6TV57_9ARAC|nr:hypothetical protein JTE90_008862 [Oedothorax gibbosus]